MKKHTSLHTFIPSSVLTIFALLISTVLQPACAQDGPLPSLQPSSTPGAYAPLVVNDPTVTPSPTRTPAPTRTPTATLPVNDTVFGIDLGVGLRGAELASSADTTWTRGPVLLWDAVEPTKGARNWDAVADLEATLIRAVELNLKVILIVRQAPTWARKYRESLCGPIDSDEWETFGRFLRDAVIRYSAPPYQVKHWEIWNEPDAPVINRDNAWGCWGEPSDPYYGGRFYGQMLKVVYPYVKASDPQSQLLVGGLLLNCDPIYPPRGADCKHSKFFEGILVSGAGPYFDGVSYHTYEYYGNKLGQYGSDNWHSAWNTTGPLLITKGRFLQDVMRDYNVTGKFMMDTELALLCWECPSTSNLETTKAYYAAQAYAAAMAEGLTAVIWYSLDGWHASGMVDSNLNPRPLFMAYWVARSKIGLSTFVGKITSSDVGDETGIAGYKFKQRDGDEVWLVWTLKGDARTVTFSRTPSAMTDALGATIMPSQSFTVTIKPVYVEWNAD